MTVLLNINDCVFLIRSSQVRRTVEKIEHKNWHAHSLHTAKPKAKLPQQKARLKRDINKRAYNKGIIVLSIFSQFLFGLG